MHGRHDGEHGPMRPLGRLVRFDRARGLIRKAFGPTRRTETVTLGQGVGRVLARTVRATRNVPGFPRSAMDGYAVRARDVAEPGARLRLVGVVHAGDAYNRRIPAGACVQIATGAPVPPGADTVVRVEDTRREGQRIVVRVRIRAGTNVGPAGRDVRRGEIAVRAGEVLSPARLGLLASIGARQVTLYARPRVGLVSTGTELRPLGSRLRRGQIYDSNSTSLLALLEQAGAQVRTSGIVPDDPGRLRRALDALRGQDLILVTGSSSAGERDHLVRLLLREGGIEFHGVHVRPGKPLLLGRWRGAPVVGLAGNPASCLVMAHVLVAPLLVRFQRQAFASPTPVAARMAHAVRSPPGKRHFLPVRIRRGRATSTYKESDTTTSLSRSDGYVEIPETVNALRAGSRVLVHPW